MGEANPELVFYLYKDSLGQTVGHLGIPSKGIPKIPFDKVLISNDSIDLLISAAQARFMGVLNESKNVVSGIWKEGENTFPLVLTPLVMEIDYTNSKSVSSTSLSLELEGDNFNYYSGKEDSKVLKELAAILERNYLRITKNMSTSFNSKIDVLIYADVEAFHNAVNLQGAPDWVVGAASKNELKMVSPLNPGSEHSYESLMKAIVHELAHTVVLNFREQGLYGLPNWLNEGYAYYEAGQLTENDIRIIQSSQLSNEIPSWQELQNASTSQFGDIGGYTISATIIEFLVKSYGMEKLKQFIIKPESIEEIYNMSEKDMEKMWLEYIEQL